MKVTHLVLKHENIQAVCTPEQYASLQALKHNIYRYRLDFGRNPEPQYIVVNTDEPYIDEIIEVLKRHGHWG